MHQTGGTRSMKQDLSDAFTNNLVTDFVVTHQLLEAEGPVQETLVLQKETPFVSFAARIGNSSNLLFTGVSDVQFCSGNQGDDQGLCDVWFENVISPLYMYSFHKVDTMGSEHDENSTSANSTATATATTTKEIIQRVEGIDRVGVITFNLVHSDNGEPY